MIYYESRCMSSYVEAFMHYASTESKLVSSTFSQMFSSIETIALINNVKSLINSD